MGHFCLSHGIWRCVSLNEKDTEKCFQNAMEIIDKFPRENKFEIREMEYGFAIKKTKGNPPELARRWKRSG